MCFEGLRLVPPARHFTSLDRGVMTSLRALRVPGLDRHVTSAGARRMKKREVTFEFFGDKTMKRQGPGGETLIIIVKAQNFNRYSWKKACI